MSVATIEVNTVERNTLAKWNGKMDIIVFRTTLFTVHGSVYYRQNYIQAIKQ
jgi:hypothetical protein